MQNYTNAIVVLSLYIGGFSSIIRISIGFIIPKRRELLEGKSQKIPYLIAGDN